MTLIEVVSIVSIAITLFAFVIAILAWRKASVPTLPHPVESGAAQAIIDSAATAVKLTTDTSTIRIADLEKIVIEFRLTITSLNGQISALRLSSETLSITLNNALNAMDALHVQVVNLQAENLGLHRQIMELSNANAELQLRISDMGKNRGTQ